MDLNVAVADINLMKFKRYFIFVNREKIKIVRSILQPV